MATKDYLQGRQKWARPQAMLWADGPGTLIDGLWVPTGYERTSSLLTITEDDISNDGFLIISDHNRSDISVNEQRIEQRRRMINGRMRSYHNSDKMVISTSWSMLPSRAFASRANFNQSTGISEYTDTTDQYTADGGAGGSEMYKWYKDHTGPFWVFLSYDNYNQFGTDVEAYGHLSQYSTMVEMYFANFDYSVVKRGGSNHDMWNISVTLEEV